MKEITKILLVLFFAGQIFSSQAQDSCYAFFNKADSSYLYHTSLDAYSFHFTGIMAIKPMSEKHRIIFTTEMGATLFDFTVYKGKCKANYLMKSVKNPFFLKVIKRDLIDLVSKHCNTSDKHVDKKMKLQVYDYGSQRAYQPIEIIIHFGKEGQLVKKYYYYFSDTSLVDPDLIVIEHNKLPIKIEMNLFYNTEE